MKLSTALRTLLLTSVCLTIKPAGLSAQTYAIVDLASNSWSYSEVHALNGTGSVAGEFESTNFFYVQAFLYTNGAMLELPHLSGTPYAVAYSVNDSNQVVGESDTAN